MTVQLFDTWMDDGHEMTMCKMTTLGEPPNAVVKLFEWNGDQQSPGFRDFDTLTDCKYHEVGAHVTITGISFRMMNELMLDRANAEVRWEVDIHGCEGCG